MKCPSSAGVLEDKDNFNFINITRIEGFSSFINESIRFIAALFSPFSFSTFASLKPAFKSFELFSRTFCKISQPHYIFLGQKEQFLYYQKLNEIQ